MADLRNPCRVWSFSPEEDGFSDEVHFERVRDTLQQIDLLYRVVERYSDTLEIVHKADDIMPVFQSGKCASLIGVEGLHQIANSSSVLRMYHRLGVRYVTLAHDKNNAFADSAVRASRPYCYPGPPGSIPTAALTIPRSTRARHRPARRTMAFRKRASKWSGR